MSYEKTSLGLMPLVLTTQRDTVPTSPPIPAHAWTAEALDAVRQDQAQAEGRAINPPRTPADTSLWDRFVSLRNITGEGRAWLLHYTIWGGAIAGGLGLIGYLVWRSMKHLSKNPKLRIEYDPLDDGLGDVYLGERLVGGVTNLAPPGRPKSWQPANERGLPLPGEYRTVEQAAEAAHRAWIAKQSKPRPAPGKAQEEPELLDVSVPEWVKDIEVEGLRTAPDFLDVWVGDDRAGYIEKHGSNWDAFAIVKKPSVWVMKQVEIGTTRKRAVTSVYVAAKMLAFLEASHNIGKGRSGAPRHFRKARSKVFGEAPRTIEDLLRTKYYNVVSDTEISGGTKMPVEEIRAIGRKLAEQRVIYGIVTRKSIGTFTRIEEADERVDQRTEPFEKSIRPEDRDAPRRRRIVSKPDIRKLRKSPMLSAEEKKKLPVVRSKHAYSFAVIGPRGAIGFYEAG
jgi:hypothetical protein